MEVPWWAMTGTVTRTPRVTKHALNRRVFIRAPGRSVERLPVAKAPARSVRGPLHTHHAQAHISGISRRIPSDDHGVAGLERGDQRRTRQLSGGGPFDVPDLFLAFRVLHDHVQEGMRIPQQEL